MPQSGLLVGREKEADCLQEWTMAGNPLVTLHGPPGSGKSSMAHVLAPRVAAAVQRYLVQLSLASATGHEDAGAQIGRALETARFPVLLVLDDIDHLQPGLGAVLDPYLERHPGLCTWACTRWLTGSPHEQRLPIRPLPEEDALRLFTRACEAHAVRPLSDEALQRRIVAHLDGLPLALELAGLRCMSMGLEELLVALERDPMGALSAPFSAPGRSLEQAFESSATCLDEPSRRLLSAVSQFDGPFSGELVRKVAGGLREADDAEDWPGGALHALVCASLIDEVSEAEGSIRFRVLKPLRTFVRGRFPTPPSVRRAIDHELGRRARQWLGEACKLGILRPEVLPQVEADRAHFEGLVRVGAGEAAVAAALLLDATRPPSRDPADRAAQLEPFAASASSLPLDLRTRFITVFAGHLDRALEQSRALALLEVTLREVEADPDGVDPGLRAELHHALGWVLRRQERAEEAQVHLGTALAFSHGHPVRHGRILADVAFLAYCMGGAVSASEERLRAARRELDKAGDQAGVVNASGRLGLLVLEGGDVSYAREDLQTATSSCASASPVDVCLLHITTGQTMHELEMVSEAGDAYQRAVALARDAKLSHLLAESLFYEGLLELEHGTGTAARRVLDAAWEAVSVVGTEELVSIVEPARVLARRLGGDAGIEGPEPPSRPMGTRGETCLREVLVVLARHASGAGISVDPDGVRELDERHPELRDGNTTGWAFRTARRLRARFVNTAPGAPVAGESATPILRLGPEASWFEVNGEERVSLERHDVLRRIVHALAASSEAGRILSVQDLFDAAWPGERAVRTSASQRVHSNILRLRRAGLGAVLRSNRQGYWLACQLVRE